MSKKKKLPPSKHPKARREYYLKNRDRIRKKNREDHLKRRYGIDEATYEAMLLDQGGLCAICGKKCKTGQRLAIDHCHTCGRVRGLLCRSCNSRLSFVEEFGIDAISNYLTKGT